MVLLEDRGVVRVAGPDAGTLLQGLLTNDVLQLAPGQSRFAALLSPQGKILFDFIVFRVSEDEFLLDAPAARTGELARRLGFYKLRAQAVIADVSADWAVVAGANGAPADPRAQALGGRKLVPRAAAPAPDASAYAAHEAARIRAGVPEGGRDFAYGEIFPSDANMDLLHGVDFAKGCYVGQEVVSRMKHRGEVRKRISRVALDGPAPAPGAAVLDGDLPVGILGTAAGAQALALLRLDRVEAAEQAGRPLNAQGVRLARLA